MTEFSNLHQLEKNQLDIKNTVLTNTIKMLTERKLLDKDKLDKNIEKILSVTSDDYTYVVDTIIKNDDALKKVAIKILPFKVTAVNKTPGILEFLNTYKKNHKIFIIKDINTKAQQHILTTYSHTEIFLEEELLINLVDHILVPKHEVLSPDDSKNFLEEYNCKKKSIPKILVSDPVARYYNMKPGDICRITRPSETAGLTYTYRLVK